MKLIDLDPRFVTYTDDGLGKPDGFSNAQGIFFLCPSCFARNGGSVGTHGLLLPFAGRGAPGKVLWDVSGTGLDDLTLAPSVLIHPLQATEGTLPEFRDALCRGWHGWIRNGEVCG